MAVKDKVVGLRLKSPLPRGSEPSPSARLLSNAGTQSMRKGMSYLACERSCLCGRSQGWRRMQRSRTKDLKQLGKWASQCGRGRRQFSWGGLRDDVMLRDGRWSEDERRGAELRERKRMKDEECRGCRLCACICCSEAFALFGFKSNTPVGLAELNFRLF